MDEVETVSVVGMGLRTPGASSPGQLWELVRSGTVAISRFDSDDAAAVGREGLGDWVGSEGLLDGVELFDHGAVGMSRGEAELTDPQHRLLLDCATDALQMAAIDPTTFDGTVGAFVGSAMSTYLLRNLLPNQRLVEDVGALNLLVHNDKDFAASLLAYRLGLTGPVLSVGAACATSLVAVHLATQALLNHECDVAVAGGVSIQVPQRQGYLAVRDGIYSPSGTCRPFDESADGTVGGSGAGIVVLRRTGDVTDDGDWALASIVGTAINNGGSERIGFAAPSVEAQARGLREALAVAGVDPASIGYVETHGTGTALGDPIEFAALARVLGADGDEPCFLGGVKANVGHLDVAAGVAGLIKTVSGIVAGRVPPLAGFNSPNRDLDMDRTRLRVPTEECPWPKVGSSRRGVVSSLGAGGTNAFVIVEESERVTPSPPAVDPDVWSVARFLSTSPAAMAATADHLARAVTDGAWAPADVVRSLASRCARGATRGALVVSPAERGAASMARGVVSPLEAPADGPVQIALVFPGNCPMIAGSAAGLRIANPSFRHHLDACLELWAERGRPEVAEVLLERDPGDDPVDIELLQPALFTIQYSLGAALLEALDQHVAVVLGHSLGEWVAGTCAGIIDLATAVDIVIARTESLRRSEAGVMAAVSLPAPAIERFLVAGAWLAADNGPDQCVVSGRRSAVEEVVASVRRSDGQASILHGERPGHTPMLESAAQHLAIHLRGRKPAAPRVPLVSTRTGDWFADPDLEPWADQLHRPVRFRQALDTATAADRLLFVEATCGSTVSGLLHRHPRAHGAVSTAGRAGLDPGSYLSSLAGLWTAGAEIEWSGQMGPASPGRRIPLPPNGRNPVRCWIDPPPTPATPATPAAETTGSLNDLVPKGRTTPDRWFSAPTWTATPIGPRGVPPERAIVLADGDTGRAIGRELAALGIDVLTVEPASTVGSSSSLVPADAEDWQRLLDEQPELPDLVVHAWCTEPEPEELQAELERGLATVVALGQALGRSAPAHEVRVAVVVAGTQRVTDEPVPSPERAALLGVTKVLPREMSPITTQFIDLPSLAPSSHRLAWDPAGAVVDELVAEDPQELVALRGGRRWQAGHAPVDRRGRRRPLPARPVILVAGGTGGIGLGIGEAVAGDGAVLVLASRTATTVGSPVADRIERLRARGVDVHLCDLDIGDREATNRLVSEIVERHGRLDCVVHAVGHPDRGGVILRRDLAELVAQVKDKIDGYRHLSEAVAGIPLHRFVMTSSIGTVLHSLKYGEVGYVAANEFVLAFGQQRQASDGDAIAIAWTDWVESGMWVRLRPELARRYGQDAGGGSEVDVLMGLTDEEGRAAALDAIASAEPSLVVSTVDLASLLEAQRVVLDHDYGDLADAFELRPSGPGGRAVPDRTSLDASDLAARLADHWSNLLGTAVGPTDNFFELGGDSLIALRVLAQVERDLGISYPMAQFLLQPDFAAFSREIEELAGVASSERFSF